MLVACNNNVLDGVVIIGIVLVNPLEKVEERLLVSDVKHQNTAMSAPIVSCRNSAKSFLASCIPHLQFHLSVLVIERPTFTVHSDCCLVSLITLIDSCT